MMLEATLLLLVGGVLLGGGFYVGRMTVKPVEIVTGKVEKRKRLRWNPGNQLNPVVDEDLSEPVTPEAQRRYLENRTRKRGDG